MSAIDRPHVIYWNNIPSPYFVGRMNAVTASARVNIEVWLSHRREPDRSWTVNERDWDFPYRYISTPGDLSEALSAVSRRPPHLYVSIYNRARYLYAATAFRRMQSRIGFRVLPTFNSWVSRSPAKEFLKHCIFRVADVVKTAGPQGTAYVSNYGMPRDRIFPVTQSIDVTVYPDGPEKTYEDGRCHFLYVGRLWRGKGIDDLLQAFSKLSVSRRRCLLTIVGDGPDEAYFRRRSRSMPNVRFAGFLEGVPLAEAYASADVFVFPTLGDPHGLVVDEAQSHGLSVISSDAAGDIIRRLALSGGGLVYPRGDVAALVKHMEHLADDGGLRQSLSRSGRAYARTLTHEAYAQDFNAFVSGTLLLPPRALIRLRTYLGQDGQNPGIRVPSQ
jgi:glycosyltransferase involved in cell wall biosynthesis